MSPDALHGVLVPVTTPFDPETGEVAPVALRALARALLGEGVHGIVVAGSTGEGPLLEDEERDRMVEWLREVVPDDRWLIVGTGAESTRAPTRCWCGRPPTSAPP
jgi:4-hydroxy-tetrahydrodipicolinate synthase